MATAARALVSTTSAGCPLRKGGANGAMSVMRLQMHATDPDHLEQRLGTAQSKGCIRIPASLNEFIDRHGVLDGTTRRRSTTAAALGAARRQDVYAVARTLLRHRRFDVQRAARLVASTGGALSMQQQVPTLEPGDHGLRVDPMDQREAARGATEVWRGCRPRRPAQGRTQSTLGTGRGFALRFVKRARVGSKSASIFPQPWIAQPLFDVGEAQCSEVAIERGLDAPVDGVAQLPSTHPGNGLEAKSQGALTRRRPAPHPIAARFRARTAGAPCGARSTLRRSRSMQVSRNASPST